MKLLVYHNGECSKCRSLTELLQSKGAEVEYKFYLHEPLTTDELKGLLQKLQLPVMDIVRTSEPLFAEQFEGKELNEEGWLQAIIDNPILLQRPIVVYGGKAVIARPAEKVLEIL
jgi:arsenate reductase